MRIEKVTVKNFRNLAEIEAPLQRGTVLVGEYRVGKSNFTHAVRLVFDPTLPNSERYRRREDFWDGLAHGTPGLDPTVAGEKARWTSQTSKTNPKLWRLPKFFAVSRCWRTSTG